jgi:hypothetical protein
MVPVHPSDGFRTIHCAANRIYELRSHAWRRIHEHPAGRRSELSASAIHAVQRVLVLASSSRGGTSVTAEFLQWQGSDCSLPTGRMLTLPAEEKPHLILAGLAFPTRPRCFDDLNEEDASERAVAPLLSEMTSEIGYPLALCTDLDLYAIQLYRRLLLQWPLQMMELHQQVAIERLARGLRRAFGASYRDSLPNRRQVLACCIESFPFILASFYDCCREKRTSDICAVEQGAWSFEEPPFIVPPPWQNATPLDIAQGTLLLRDPSNAWRLRFWKAVFASQKIVILHLIRDAQESIQGLCDGWNYSFGFQTLPSAAPLRIAGYTETSTGASWKQHRLNFSVDRGLSYRLLEKGQPLTLVEVCAHQWRAAHERLMDDSDELGLRRIPLRFSALRADPVHVFAATCMAAGLEVSPSGIAYGQSFPSRLVMATDPARGANWARWRNLPYAAEILGTVDQEEFRTIIRRLASPPATSDVLAPNNAALQDAQPAFLCASA